MNRLDGKRIVITGSSRGLGKAFALAAAQEGARVIVNGTNADALEAARAEIAASGATVAAYQGSVADTGHCEALINTCIEHYGGIDALVNNAGIVRDRTLFKMTDDDFDQVVAVHLRGAWACAKYAALAFRDAHTSARQGGGHIVNVISASGLSGGFGQGNYAAAKAGMMGLMRTWLLELPKFGIRCNALWPIADTDMTQVVFERANAAATEHNQTPPTPAQMGFGQPSEVAQGMVWLLSDAAAHFNGQCMTFNGRKVALWTHPQEVAEAFHENPWQFDELTEHFKNVATPQVHRPKLVSDS